MATLGAQTPKLKDEFDELLNIIGQSGVYDFVLGKLKDLAAAFKQALDDGTLADSAKSISDADRLGQRAHRDHEVRCRAP